MSYSHAGGSAFNEDQRDATFPTEKTMSKRTPEAEPIRVGLPDDSLKLTPGPTEQASEKPARQTDLELQTMGEITRRLSKLDTSARNRILAYLIARYVGGTAMLTSEKLPPGTPDARD